MKPQQVFDKLSLIQHKSENGFTFSVDTKVILKNRFNFQIPITKSHPIYIPLMKQLITNFGKNFAVYDNHLSWWVNTT